MKIKRDFVTNSSSTAMIVFIPEQYNLETERIVTTEEYKDYLEDEEPTKEEMLNIIDKITDNMNYLQLGKEISIDQYGRDKLIFFEILSKDDLILKKIEVDGPGATTVYPITLDELKGFISKVESK
jgi:hypothetical protein